MITSPPQLTMHVHLPRYGVLGPDPEPLGSERFARIMAALDHAEDADGRAQTLPHPSAGPQQQPALAA